jgi:C-terminal processing protease CtpA/Prc
VTRSRPTAERARSEKIDGVKTAGKSLHDCETLVHGAPGTTVILELTNPDDPTPVMAALKRE